MPRKFSKDRSGATAIEYGLIAALVSVALITAMQEFGGELGEVFSFFTGQNADVKTP